jgi:hypothetical protein
MTRCSECEFDWESTQEQVVAEFAHAGHKYRTCWNSAESSGVPTDVRVEPGTWSAIEYLAHVCDVFTFYLDRIHAVLTTDRPVMASARLDLMVEDRVSSRHDADTMLEEIDQLLFRATHTLAPLSPSEWERIGLGSSGDERSILDLARRMAHESQHHRLDLDLDLDLRSKDKQS